MHDETFWRTAATLATTGTLCLAVACGGGEKTAAKSTTPQTPSQTQTTGSPYGEVTPYGGEAPQQQYGTTGAAPAPAPSEVQPQAAPAPSAAPQTMPSGVQPTPTGGELANLNDDQIVAIVNAVNASELQQAQLVKDHAQNARVKRFAEHMLATHGQIGREQHQLVTKQKITPMETAASQHVSTEGKQLVGNLRKEKGHDFDRDYIDAQVTQHRDLLNMLDNNLIPQAKNAELKSMLQNVRTKVEAHLRDAEEIQREVEK